MEFYYALPEDDPHYVPSPERRRQLQRERGDAKCKDRQERIDASYKVKADLRTALYEAQREGNYELADRLSRQFLEAHERYEAVRKGK